MIPYILHVSILIAAGLLFYKLALKRLTFYVMNRWVLLSCLAAAFLLPFMPMPKALSWGGILGSQKATPDVVTVVVKQEVGEKSVAMTGPQPGTVASENIRRERIVRTEEFARTEKIAVRPIPIAARAPTAPAQVADPHEPSDPGASALASGSAARALFYFYLSGVLLLGINLLRQVVLLLFQRYRGQVIRDGRYRIVTTAGMQGPCSFGNIIFIHPGEYDPVTYQQILLHEKIHAGGWHTVDILVAELGIVFQWFNPFIWLYRREMENNLEFLTDRNVLRYPGVERADYQLSLVKVAAPDVSFNITSNYNQSLLKRRIIMMNAQNSARHTAWKYFFLLPLFVLLAGVLNRPAVQAQTVRQKPSSPAKPMRPAGEGTKAVSGSREKPAAPEAKPSIQAVADVEVVTEPTVVSTVTPVVETNVHAVVVPSVNVTMQVAPVISVSIADTSKPLWGDRSEGAWFIVGDKDKKDDKITIELRGESDDHNWNSSFGVPRSQLSSLNSVGKVEFTLTREAGVIHFTGQFDGEQGFGRYKFQPDADYLAHMRQKKIVENGDELMTFFMLDIKKSYVDMLRANGFPEISRRHIISMAALHIDEDYIKSIRTSGYSDITENQLITLKSLKIDGDYLHKFPASTPVRDIVTYKSLRIDSGYVASLKKAGYPDISSREIVTMKSMNVDADFIKGFLDLGYKDITPRRLTSLKAMNITPDFVRSFNAIGFKDIPLNQLTSLKAMGVTPDYVARMKEKGFVSDDLNKYIRLKNAFE